MAILEIKNLYKNFGRTEVLKGVDFSMEEGEVVSIIGSSGSGKTTLLRMIAGIGPATSGELFIDGEEMKQALSGYLSVLCEQDPKSVGGTLPTDGFYYVQ